MRDPCTSERCRCAISLEITFPRPGGAIVFVPFVAGRGKIQRPARGHIVDGLYYSTAIGRRNYGGGLSILERTFDKIDDVVHNDVASGGAQIADVLCKLGNGWIGCRKKKLRTRCQVMHDFQHRCAFIADASLSRQHGHCGQIPAGLKRR